MTIEKKEYLSEMQRALEPHFFKRRGQAFFRVNGDGIVQVIKLEFERISSHYAIRFGLHSMYEILQPSWFSSNGCITRYAFVNLIGEQTTVRMKRDGNFVQANPISICEQMDVMCHSGISFLEEICTQAALIAEMHRLDRIRFGKNFPLSMNMSLFAPCLYVGDRDGAKSIIEKYLCQHKIPNDKWYSESAILEAKQSLLPIGQKVVPADIQLARKADLVFNATPDEIQKWLRENYDNNVKLARFCM